MMKHLRLLCISVFIGFIAGLSTPSWADDTDLYLNQALKLSVETYPNVLFMLDNSGSMNDRMRTDDGVDLGVTRIAVLKKALEAVINDANNVNLGLARFTFSTDGTIENGKAVAGTAVDKTNAPIMYPIAYVDAALEEVESGSANASVMIPSSATLGTGSDDAEEIVDTKKVSISDPNLEMVTQEVPPGVKTEIRIASNRDQAMEYTNKSVVVGTAKAMFFGKEITNVRNNAQDNGEVLTAVRFPNLGIPQGATIHKVEADFTSDEGPLSTTFKDWGEDIAYDND
jgi:type IV pilus assembly protein PilY1